MNKQIKIIKSGSSKELFDELNKLKSNKNLRTLILNFDDETCFENLHEFGGKSLKLLNQFPILVILLIKEFAADFLFEILLASHICIASDSAKFVISDKRLLKNQIGSKNFGKLETVENKIDAKTALDLGIINRIVDKNNLEKEAFELAEKISGLAPLAIKSCLKAVNKGLEMDLEAGLELETKLFSQIFATEDMREGTSAFLEKRQPVFRGK